MSSADDRDPSVLQWLTERLQTGARKLGELVQEKAPAVREGDLAGTDPRRSPADQSGRRDAVMRRAERTRSNERLTRRQRAGGRVYARHLQRLGDGETRKDSRQRTREQCLAGARRSRQKQVVAAGRRYLERALRAMLIADRLEI